jgi:hypothetical protein
MRFRILCLLLFLLGSSFLHGQLSIDNFFKDVELRIDTSQYRWGTHTIDWKGEPHFWFAYQENDAMAELRLYPANSRKLQGLMLMPSGDFSVVDSLSWVNESYYRLKIRFNDLTNTDYLQLIFSIRTRANKEPLQVSLPLFPTTETKIGLQQVSDELFIGEERVFELQTNNIDNVRLQNRWKEGGEVNYRLTREQNRLLLNVLPEKAGQKTLELQLTTRKPFMNDTIEPTFQIPPIYHQFLVKPAKLAFLNFKPFQLVLHDKNRGQGIEVELDYGAGLELEKTYRIEAQERPGGALIAEVFTRSVLANGKVLCWLRLYDFHRRGEGYLYIKDGDQARYVTNMNIVPQTTINDIQLLREGGEWKAGNQVFPGERLGIRLEGVELQRANLSFEGLTGIQLDTLASNSDALVYRGEIPMDIAQRNIQIFNNNEPTGASLQVKEYERPRVLDFIRVQYGESTESFLAIDKLVFVEEALDDIIILFDPNQIDQGRLYGPQHLEIEIEVRDQESQLIDQRTLPPLTICPGEGSPRASFYADGKCQNDDFGINSYLRKKIFDLDLWSTVRITIRHREEAYQQEGFSHSSEFVLFRAVNFDIDVSFPAGLLTKRVDQAGFGNLGGISMAMIAQFSFFHPKKIAKAKPYKFGVGFLALNAFNFNEDNNDRDVGLVALASLHPIRTKYSSKLSFPLYVGGGYFLSEQKWFLLLGPGIRISL